ncbi:MAG: nickel-binding protein [Chitinophagaceae bacterium]
MPIFMDLHIVPGVNAKDVAEAHSRDVYLEKDHNCKCLTYWIDETRGHVFCLIDAPNKETVYELHNRSHGLLPHKIIEVQNDFVESFLGRITDPESGQYTNTGLLMLDDTSYRIIMSVNTTDSILLHHQMGLEGAVKKVEKQNTIIRDAIRKHGGKEALHEGRAIIGSFIAAENAVNCGLAIQEQMNGLPDDSFSVQIHAGEPVAQTDELFGDTLQLLQWLGMLKRKEAIIITDGIKELIAKDMQDKRTVQLLALTLPDEQFLISLFDVLNKNYADNEFSAENYAQILTMSKSQMYRRVTALTGYSPNDLLKEFRLEKAKELLRKKKYNVFEVALETGFTSASYFTKCFKTKFGLLPLAYQQLV